GIVALEEMVDRLAEDHANARRLAAGLSAVPGIDVDPVATNIVLFRVAEDRFGWPAFVAAARAAGVAVDGFGHGRIRAVAHAGVWAAAVPGGVSRTGGLRAARGRPFAEPARPAAATTPRSHR